MFAEKGYDGVSTRDIAIVAGVSQAYVIRRFGSKNELFTLALARQLDALINELHASGARDSDTLDELVAAYRRFLNSSAEAALIEQLWIPAQDRALNIARRQLWTYLRQGANLQQAAAVELIGRIGAHLGTHVFEHALLLTDSRTTS